MKNKTINTAIIGCGRLAKHYFKILNSGAVKGINIIGVCDENPSKSNEYAKLFNCAGHTNYETMLKKIKPDLVLILTPSGFHTLHTRIALEHNTNVMVEKPLSLLSSDTKSLIALAKSKNLILEVAFQNRFNPAIQALKKALDKDRLGKIVSATVRLRWCRYQEYYEDGWHGTWAQDGGVSNQQAIHHIDALDWLLGPIDSICSTTGNRLNNLEAEDTMVAIVKFSSGALGTIEATTAARPKDYEASLSVVGEKGLIVVGGIALNKIETWNFVEPEINDSNIQNLFSQDVPTGYGLSHGPLLQSIVDQLRSDHPINYDSVEQAFRTTSIIHAIYYSDEIKKWVKISDNPISLRLGKKT